MNNLNNSAEYNEIKSRIQKLSPGSKNLWGKMTVNQMICHVSDPIRDILGIRITEPVVPEEMRPQIIQMILNEFAFDHNAPTFQPYLQEPGGGGTRPTDFETDKKTLLELVDKFYSTDPSFQFHPHAGLGILNKDQFGVYLWKHLDHHLRSFGE